MGPTILVFKVLRGQGSWFLSCVATWALFCGSTVAQSKTNPDANPWVLDYGSEGPWNAVTQLVDFPEQNVTFFPSLTQTSLFVPASACDTQDSACQLQRTGMWSQSPAHSLSNWVNVSIPDASRWDVAADPLALEGAGTLTIDRIVLWSANRADGPYYLDGIAISIASNYTAADSIDTPYTLDVGMLSLHTGLDTINWTTGNGSDVSLEVTWGGWPFLNATDVDPDHLLRSDGASTNNNETLTVMPNPGVPYMYLPKDTCSTIAAFLPVTFDQSLGHYIWNTTKPAFKKIMSSPSALKFSFRTDSGIQNISVPFALLNLTLDYPLVSTPTQYFPCVPYTPSDGSAYHLGRAFLQAAFLGQHGQAQKTFLAQAPGPGAKAEAITKLGSTDTTLTAMANPPYWDATWSDQLEALPTNNGSGKTITKKSGGISGGAIAGIVVGVVAGLGLCAIAGFVLHRRRKSSSKQQIVHWGGHENKQGKEDVVGVAGTVSESASEAVYEIAASEQARKNGNKMRPAEMATVMRATPDPSLVLLRLRHNQRITLDGVALHAAIGSDDAPASPLPPRRPPLGHRHSSTSSHVSQSPSDSTTKGHHKPAHHKPQRHVVSHHNRMGSRNPSFHRSLSKIKIQQHDPRQHDDDEPPTPKAKQQASVASQSTLVPPSPARPNMKRNNTSVHLPRNHSHAGLKKNLSSGQLSRLTAAKSTAHGRTTSQHQRPDIRRAHTQPYKRSKSPAPKASQVAFDVGDDDDDDDAEEMEGVDDQWTEESASASPNTTRDNTRNNTRQNSVVLDPKLNPYARQLAEEEAAADSSGSDTIGSRSPPKPTKAPVSLTIRTKDFAAPQAAPTSAPQQQQPPTSSYNAQAAQHHMPDADAIARRLLERNSALNAAPPRVSSVSALANPNSADPKSLSASNAGQSVTNGSNTPLVSRFISNDGINSKDGTPADQSGFLQGPKGHSRTVSQAQTRKEQSDLYRNQSTPNFASQKQPPTPSGSGAVTPDPALNQSRTQQKLWLQRGLSNIEASSQPHLPGLLPTGRAQAMRTPHAGKQFEFVDKEWAVVRRFQNPLDAGLERLRKMNGGALPGRPNKAKAGAAQQHTNGGVNGHRRGPSNAASIASKKSDATVVAGPEHPTAGRKSRVSFHMGEAEGDNDDDEHDEHNSRSDRETPADIARRLWNSPIGIQVEG
ncbi:hypothetical protein E4T48_02404 [Aureobasidium sp. EXF-10727]|nr:hypothetical protein E4T48_02404 [Aureobasidium sp. EXF-10727]